MIYRIAIGTSENGKWKFSHYATMQELRFLRVNTDGIVEKLKITNVLATGYREAHTGLIAWAESEHTWQDVLETHHVEWGFVQDDISVYENDIVETSEERSEVVLWGTKFCINDELCLTLDYLEDIKYDVIGNINENPELLEGKE